MKDGHIHTPYCPHGSNEALESYIERAISLDYSSMTFTEHAPLPPSFTDPAPNRDSSMKMEDVNDYLETVSRLKKAYKDDITIHTGFEVDYIYGYEREIEAFLDRYGPYVDDSILSVHFLKPANDWYCIDYSPAMFNQAINDAGSIYNLYSLYYAQLKESALCDLGRYKPKRIGHMTLVKKFQQIYDPPAEWRHMAIEFLDIVKKQELSLDYNGAGIKKEYCLETYPPLSIATLASSKGIPLIYGSDAHHPDGLKQGYETLNAKLIMK
ncbi:histidinol-phosphatase HisJ [Halobacillus sp. A5]|uniref:histidinol-phosphatase HisJ n=1 Tax=Halobacillus sp. A5 TaxID=2880263 RepID=UPI0020A64199|nr:histidinol-phosphatase HisJ [Halobacillus sp. A5]MCP3025382.1 histidinol-phosphatase HisJ [Halobacillus sp. A5]